MSDMRAVLRRARNTTALAALALVLSCGLAAAPAGALIADATPIDGPGADVVDLGGVDMSDDGTGGLVYRKRVGGRTHIFASRFDGKAWGAAVQVDAGQSFDSSWPQIAAGDGGRLLVTWVQEFGAGTDRMFGAALGPGATRFQAPIPVDFNVGEATATFPSLAMNAVGTAYLAYRVVLATSQGNSSLPPGTVDADVRVARTTGALWSVVGQPLDRNPLQPVATPTAANSPRIGVDRNGNAILAWQEPDDDQVDRIWARRMFGLSFGNPLQVSPSALGAAKLRGRADGFSLAVAGFGEGAIAYRQQPDLAAGLPQARIYTNTIPESFSDQAGAFAGARIADGTDGPGPAPPLGVPSVAVTPQGRLLVAFGAGLGSLAATGDDTAAGPVARLDDGDSLLPGDPVAQIGSDGAAVLAWKLLRDELGGVVVQERRADGVLTKEVLTAPQGGVIDDLRSAGSGLGDAALAFLQGSGPDAQVAASFVNAPPQQFAVQAPVGFTRARRIPISWDPAEHAIGRVTYDVAVDDEQVASNLTATRATLTADDIGDGVHAIVVTATDGADQPTESTPAEAKVDRRTPRIALRRRGRALAITISDGPKSSASGVSAAGTSVSFGEGRPLRGRVRVLRHVYRRPGRFRVTVRTRDRAGNPRSLRRTVTIP